MRVRRRADRSPFDAQGSASPYMGHDTFTIEDRKLVRVFPVYNQGDTNEKPTGGRRKLVYGLVPGEAGWQLRIEQREERKGQVKYGNQKIFKEIYGTRLFGAQF
jgi:hypothetical protein